MNSAVKGGPIFNTRSLWAKGISLGILTAWTLLLRPAGVAGQPQVVGAGSLMGYIYGQDFKTAVAEAVVKVRNVETGQEFSCAPTEAIGLFKFPTLPEGRYVLGVSCAGEDFNFSFQVFIKAREMGKLSLALVKQVPPLEAGLESVYALPKGTAVASKKKTAAAFFATPVGVATAVAATGLSLICIYSALNKEEEVSPSKR